VAAEEAAELEEAAEGEEAAEEDDEEGPAGQNVQA